MSISSVSASNQINLAAFFAPAQGSPRHAEHGDRDSGDGNSEGITVLASLLEALVQAATPSASSATPTAGAAAAGTSTPAPTTGAATGTTGATSTTTGTTSTGTTSTGTGTTSTTNLVADLQAFLHDLFSALRQAGRSGHGGREHEHWRERAETTTSAPTTPTTSAPASSATPAAPATSSGTVTATTSSPAAGSTTPVAVTNPAIGAYGPRNIISELKALVQELSSGQASSSTGSSGGVSQNLLSNLNSAFEKLISDLKGTASAAGTTSTAGTAAAGTAAAGTSTSGTAAASASTAAPSTTAALQAFLTNFAQDLQNNGAHSLNPVGTSVNTTA